jgi:aspartate racemase
MRTIGLLGGMSWESSIEYYRFINECARDRLGGLHSARSLMFSFDFDEIEQLQRAGRWALAGERLAAAARSVESAGADLLVLCTNTMHRVADEVQAAVSIPLLHLTDPTAEAIRKAGVNTVGLLATRYTMDGEFYRGRLESRYGLRVLIPDEPARTAVHDIIYEELVVGIIRDESRRRYVDTVDEMVERGAEAVILGCTEIELLLDPADVPVPAFDTTRLHAEAAVEVAIGQRELAVHAPAG